jgi:hypothetical protein
MGDTTEKIQATLGTLMDRIDAMSSQLQDLGKQLEITQVSVDEVRKKPPGSSRLVVQIDARESGPALLANKGAPLLPLPTATSGQAATPSSPQGFVTAPRSPTHQHTHHAKPPKHNFPKFSGENPRLWIDLCDTYFEMYLLNN